MITPPKLTFAEKRGIVRQRRENGLMFMAGYTKHETDWEILRGSKQDHVIIDVKISEDGKHVWVKIGKRKPV